MDKVFLDIKHVLDKLYPIASHYYLSSSMLKVVREYYARISIDIEYFTLLSAIYDFQMPVSRLIRNFNTLVEYMDKRNMSILDISNLNMVGLKRIHRFDPDGTIYRIILTIFNQMNLEKTARNLHANGVEEIIRGLLSEIHLIFNEKISKNLGKNIVRRFKNFIPSPKSKSSFKRLCLFLRWIVRREYPDLGLWRFVDPSELYIPLDIGIARIISRMTGMGIRPSWSNVIKLTEIFKKLDPRDPTKYDFPLSRITILGICKSKYEESDCNICPLRNHCRKRLTKKIYIEEEKTSEHDYLKRIFKDKNPWNAECISEHAVNGRIDIICFKPSINNPTEIYLVEIKITANRDALKQILYYKNLCAKRYPQTKIKTIAIATKNIDKNIKELSQYNEINIWMWNENIQNFIKIT